MEATLIIALLALFCSVIIATNNLFGLRDRAKAYLRRKLEVPSDAERLQANLIESDQALFDRIREMLPSEYPMMKMREHDFGNSFKDNLTSGMHRFVWESKKPEFGFHDAELEKLRAALEEALKSFLSPVSLKTFPVKGTTDVQRVPVDWQRRHPVKWRETIKEIKTLPIELRRRTTLS